MDRLLTPFRFRDVSSDATLVVNEVGDYGFFNTDIVSRLFSDELKPDEEARLREMHILLRNANDWRFIALATRARHRIARKSGKLAYMLIIPTLRCDLACSYCQVSRASETAKGYDLKPEYLDQLERFWERYAADSIKIEFQGGEPTLRSDLVSEIMDRATRHFEKVEFAICTNLMNLTPAAKDLLADPRMHVSTSIDGPIAMMAANRTGTTERAENFFQNLNWVIDTHGQDKVSALPTIPEHAYDKIEEIIDFYRELGFRSIFLRPVNYMGFARKKHASSLDGTERWNKTYFRALERIMQINKTEFFEEFYASMVFQKIVGVTRNNFVDFRSPNRYFEDYCVIDYDGGVYPTDEARMLSRSKLVDLKIGELSGGIDYEKLGSLNQSAMNEVHPDCIHCSYGPFCGIDLIDDLSRYGRIDMPKHETAFCKRNLDLFDLLFAKIKEQDRTWLDPLMSWAYRKSGAMAPFEILYD
jgi:His-Xaa-Ser system radical SAM maturase HxsB